MVTTVRGQFGDVDGGVLVSEKIKLEFDISAIKNA
jgi:hypothetical protein